MKACSHATRTKPGRGTTEMTKPPAAGTRTQTTASSQIRDPRVIEREEPLLRLGHSAEQQDGRPSHGRGSDVAHEALQGREQGAEDDHGASDHRRRTGPRHGAVHGGRCNPETIRGPPLAERPDRATVTGMALAARSWSGADLRFQARLMWEWRPTRFAMVRRTILSFVVACLALAGTAWVLPGLTVDGFGPLVLRWRPAGGGQRSLRVDRPLGVRTAADPGDPGGRPGRPVPGDPRRRPRRARRPRR